MRKKTEPTISLQSTEHKKVVLQRAAIDKQDGSINSPDNPATLGSVVTLYITGAGQMQPPVPDGQIATDIRAKPALPVSVVEDERK